MNVDNLMSDMTMGKEMELIGEVAYVNLYQMNRTLQKDDMVTVMECDVELVEELGLIAGDNVTDEEDDDKYVTEISVETEAQVNQQELKLNSKGKKPYRKYTDAQIDHY
ncbi:hypothetical protein INT47_006300 [Mucor saturninus]|uniref:Uncharacterized protein n=1 Tax=Mucor saturninus TaxID=64648 RepID=A0A8H7RHE2_9FUNG|nr:hypothetical protein INT47_006300 [Mucor saturninus]